jgi:hypothetical protein
MTSGAEKQGGVKKEHCPRSNVLERPKSTNLMILFWSTRILSGFSCLGL